MKQKVYIFFAITILSVFMAIPSEAGYYMKKKAPVVTTATTTEQPGASETTAAAESTTSVLTKQKAFGKKQGFFSKLLHKLAPHRASIPQIAYIILCFLPFAGGIAMGINDDFSGYYWILGVLLYLLGYIPGVVYTLVMMGRYY